MMPLVERAFGVKLPTYAGLVARSWQVAPPAPTPPPLPVVVEPAPDLQPWVVLEDPTPDPVPVPTPPVPPTPPAPIVVVRENKGIVEVVMAFVKIIAEVIARAFGR